MGECLGSNNLEPWKSSLGEEEKRKERGKERGWGEGASPILCYAAVYALKCFFFLFFFFFAKSVSNSVLTKENTHRLHASPDHNMASLQVFLSTGEGEGEESK